MRSISDLKTLHKIVKMTHKHTLNVLLSTHQLVANNLCRQSQKNLFSTEQLEMENTNIMQ